MVTDQEIEATLKQSVEIDRQFQELLKQVQDPSKNLTALFESADKEFARLGEVLKTPNAPASTAGACFEAAVELIGDWGEMEAVAIQGMHEADGGAKSAKTGSVNRAPRRGMRI